MSPTPECNLPPLLPAYWLVYAVPSYMRTRAMEGTPIITATPSHCLAAPLPTAQATHHGRALFSSFAPRLPPSLRPLVDFLHPTVTLAHLLKLRTIMCRASGIGSYFPGGARTPRGADHPDARARRQARQRRRGAHARGCHPPRQPCPWMKDVHACVGGAAGCIFANCEVHMISALR